MTMPSTKRLTGRAVVRSADEEHRASTPLELFFDLTYVVAVGRAAASLHHELGAGHLHVGLIGFPTMFFAVWWGWMNFTWFASAHDSDDIAHRLLTFVQITGVLVFAAGVTRAAEHSDYLVVVIGYAIMRVGLILSWLRVARDEPTMRERAIRYTIGLTILQLLWIGRLAIHGEAVSLLTFAILAIGELSIPVIAERAGDIPTFHPEHIEERYGLFTIILLGESILAATASVQASFDAGGLTAELAAVGFGGLVLAFASWWLYFDHPGHLTPTPDVAFRWGYAHVVMFAALAGLGAGIALAAETVTDHGPPRTASLAVAVPMAAYLLGLVLVMVVTGATVADRRIWPKIGGAVAMLLIGLLAPVALSVVGCAGVMVSLAAWMVIDGSADGPSDMA